MSLNLDKTTWKRVAFGDVVQNLNVTLRDPASEGIDRIIAMEHLDPGELKISRWGDLADGTTFTRRVRPGQTLFGKRRAYQRKAALADFDAICSGDILVFEADPQRLLPELLPFLLQSNGFYDHALGTSAGSLSPRTNWRDIARYEFDLPPLDDQKRIADLMWTLEAHRVRAAAAESESLRVADEAFSDQLTRLGKQSIPLPDLLDDVTVGVVVKPTQYYTDDTSGVPALRGLNIQPGRFVLDELVRFRRESAKELAKSTLRVGDVVVVRTGRPGDAVVVTEEVDGFNCIDLIIVRPGSGLVPEFVASFLNSSYGRAQIARLSAGTAQQHFNVGALKKLTIPDLTVDDQTRLTDLVEFNRNSIQSVSRELSALSALKTSLSAEIFGEHA